MLDLKRHEVWFVTGSQELYGKETLEKVADNSRAIARHLDESGALPVRVVWKPALTSPEAILKVCQGRAHRPRAPASSHGCTRSRRRRCGSPG